jgi:type III secretory pathway component EscU
MNEIAKLIVTLVTVFSAIGSLFFYLNVMSGVMQIYQGDTNAVQNVTESVADEAISQIEWSLGIYALIAIASALGLTGFVVMLKKMR